MPGAKVTDPKVVIRQKERALARARSGMNIAQARLRQAEQELEAAKSLADPHEQISQLIWLKLMVAFNVDAIEPIAAPDEDDDELDDLEEDIDDLIDRVKRGRFGPSDFMHLARLYNSYVPASDRVRLAEITKQIVAMVKSSDMETQ